MIKLNKAILRIIMFLMILFCDFVLVAQSEIKVPYIEKTPIIDGRLDDHLKFIPKHKFNFYSQFDNPKTDSIRVSYALAYNDKYLYLYIETNADTISYHKRGYLWGDGYKLLIGLPNKGKPTSEYYELSYSPSKNQEDDWDQQRIASYNGNQRNPPLGIESKSQELAYDGVSGFESFIAWSDIEPYHPAFMKKMAFGLYFAKGKWRKDVGYFSNGYFVVDDPGIFNEEVLQRLYVPIYFQEPAATTRFSVQSTQRNITVGDDLQIEISSTHKEKTKPLNISITNDLNETVFNKSFQNLKPQASLTLPELSVGVYTIIYETLGYNEKEKLGILPKWDYREIKKRIAESTNSFSRGTLNTLYFKAEQITKLKTELSWYESGKEVITLWKEFEKEYRQLIAGIDPFENKTIPYRRAFLSVQDSTLQPYSIKLPKEYDPKKKYPLLVFLHGSGQDEQTLLKLPRSNGTFIELAPYGRDRYYTYASKESQIDIVEAIEDVSTHFSIDTNKVIIGGFSMGGYGALRTFYEHPKRYAGVAVFAGHPNLANMWLDGNHPNFTIQQYCAAFKNIPVFVYHGTKDPALDVSAARQLINNLEKAGAKVSSSIVEDRGHIYQDKTTNKYYHQWLNQIVNKK